MDEHNPPRLYLAHMPDVFGHGLMAFSLVSHDDARKKVKAAYREQFLAQNGTVPEHRFADRWEYYGGNTHEIDINKVYDSF